MLPSRQSNSPRGTARRRLGAGAFTLIELIFVMVLLAVGAAMVAPSMASFYRGRLLSSEARRVLALVHYGQSRAIAEGVPVLLWINAKDSSYGLRLPSSETGGDGSVAGAHWRPGTDAAPAGDTTVRTRAGHGARGAG